MTTQGHIDHIIKRSKFLQMYLEIFGGLLASAQTRREHGWSHEEILESVLDDYKKLLRPMKKELEELNKEREKLYEQSLEA